MSNIDLFKESIRNAKIKFLFDIYAIVVMQDHCPNKTENIPLIVRAIKYYFSANIPKEYLCSKLSESAIKRNEKGIWQRRYYNHKIRDENNLYRHLDYIHYNPVKHYNIAPKHWNIHHLKILLKTICTKKIGAILMISIKSVN